jgi:chaperonin GroES
MSKTATKPAKSASKTSVRPLGDKIIVRRDEAQTKTDSGIFLPETGKERPKTGTVEAVGTGSVNTETGARVPLTIKKGDRIIFTSYAGTELKLDGDELLIMGEDDVLAIID